MHQVKANVWSMALGAILLGNVRADAFDRTAAEVLLIRSFARQNIPEAQSLLGTVYFAGFGVPRDYREAAAWFTKAAAQGDRNAKYFLGNIYDRGLGVSQDSTQAEKWYRHAAEQGHPRAQTVIGIKYLAKDGASADHGIAARWLYRAAMQGTAEAAFILARLAGTGSGVPKDISTAFIWATIAETWTSNQLLKDQAAKFRNLISASMTSEQLALARETAAGWRPVFELPLRQQADMTRSQDGLSASLSVQRGEAIVRWRELQRSTLAPSELTGTVDGKPMGIPTLEQYPGPGASTSVLLVMDVTDSRRALQLERDKTTVVGILNQAQPHHQISLATYGVRLRLIVPDRTDLTTLVNATKRIQMQSSHANLGQALQTALMIPSVKPAERCAIFVFTDGHTDDALDSNMLIEVAKRTGTSLNFILSPTDRSVDRSVLQTLAQGTGGEVVMADQLEAFIQAPFALVDSGAMVRFPLNNARGNYGDPNPEAKVVLQYGDNQLELISTVVDEAWRERAALEETLRTCDPSCAPAFRMRVQDSLNLFLEEERTFKSAQNDPERLDNYMKECRLCIFKDDARVSTSSIHTEQDYEKLEAAGLDKDELDRLFVECHLLSCSDGITFEIESRLALATQAKAEEEGLYLASRGDIEKLRSYVSSCLVCQYAGPAQQEITALEQK